VLSSDYITLNLVTVRWDYVRLAELVMKIIVVWKVTPYVRSVPTFQRNLLFPLSRYMTADCCETSMENTRRHTPQGNNLQIQHCYNLRSPWVSNIYIAHRCLSCFLRSGIRSTPLCMEWDPLSFHYKCSMSWIYQGKGKFFLVHATMAFKGWDMASFILNLGIRWR
jgi:hypothetical protein